MTSLPAGDLKNATRHDITAGVVAKKVMALKYGYRVCVMQFDVDIDTCRSRGAHAVPSTKYEEMLANYDIPDTCKEPIERIYVKGG